MDGLHIVPTEYCSKKPMWPAQSCYEAVFTFILGNESPGAEKMASFFMPSFATRAHGDGIHERWSNQCIPPLVPGLGAINFDYSPLLISKSLIMDGESYDLITARGSPIPVNAREEMRILKNEGFIELRDYRSVALPEKHRIAIANNAELSQLEEWYDTAVNTIEWWMNISERFSHRFESEFIAMGRLPFAIDEYVYKHYGIDERIPKGIDLWDKLKLARAGDPKFFSEVLKELVGTILDYVHTNLVLASRFGSINYEWENYQQPYARKILRPHIPDFDIHNGPTGHKVRDGVQSVLSVIVPTDLSAIPPKNLVSLLQDRRIEEVRGFIGKATREGEALPEEVLVYIAKMLAENTHVDAKKRRISFWIKPFSALIPSPALDYIAEVLWNTGEMVAEHVADSAAQKAAVGERRAAKEAARAVIAIRRNLTKG